MSAERAVASFTLPAYAKINLGLRVLGRRPDGYHELRTVFQTITLHDDLTFTARPDTRIELACAAPDIPTDDTNLVQRAAAALRERYNLRSGARIELTKRIPAGGGLGGGSSDAAVALVGLAHLWQIKTNAQELHEIGARLGADVPFFFNGGTALGTGRGTEISALADHPKMHLIVVTPGVKISTAEAYKALSAPALTKADSPANLPISRTQADAARALSVELTNDFAPVVFRLQPEIARAHAALLKVGARAAALSGSGASVFGIFDSERTRGSAHTALQTEAGWQVFACTTLARTAYRQALGACAALLA
ncbi:MAG TPA: 4-(cytidine 5'-diphospho)-2-C-methyl-D-erythritol kinase [Pyrinomonadaceae bacterium]